MRRRAAQSRITLELKDQLRKRAERTELNYRTRVTTDQQDAATTVRLLSILTLLFIVVGFTLRLLTVLPVQASGPLFLIFLLWMLWLAHRQFLRGMPSGFELLLVLTVVLLTVLFAVVSFAPTMASTYLVLFGPAVFVAALFSHFATAQACAFMAVNERIPWRPMRRWQRTARRLLAFAGHKECPELADYRLSYLFLILAFGIGYAVLRKTEGAGNAGYAAMLGVLAFLVTLFVIRLFFPGPGAEPVISLVVAADVTWKALTTFLCYNRHQIDAAGLFRFPTKRLRPPLARDLFLGVTLAFLTTALVGASFSWPYVLIERFYPQAANAAGEAKKPAAEEDQPAKPEFKLSATEEEFSRTLPQDQRAAYFEAKKREHEAASVEAEKRAANRAHAGRLADAGFSLAVCWLGPSVVLFAVMWFTGGPVLRSFHLALEAPDASEIPPDPTKEELAAGTRGITPWDHRVQRMQLSRDSLEREHFYLGSSIEGDFPVLLHQEILYRHGHILGDTGSRKTSIGIAPLVTQLIDRGTNSVVIIDLKGDRTLFNAAKDEAAAAGLPFKWFTNKVGESSFVFNPLAQSHLPRLTTDQLTQGILQALELEHGEGYGRGHFTALNDAVLGAYLHRYRRHVGSFAELHEYVSDRNAYRTISNDDEDWRHTRQLVNLVEKVAHLGPMNVTAATAGDKPRVLEEQIDMPSVLRTPQVVYFFLSSSLDPRTVSPIAKLAMFALLGASEFRNGIEPRTFVFIDEFQRVISEAMTLFFEQARSKGLHFILANQALSQLNAKGVDITGVIDSCTGFKQSFRASDEANIKRIIENSGEAVYHDVSWSRIVRDAYDEQTPHLISLAHALRWHSGETSVNVKEEVGPRIERNTLIEASAMPLASFIHFTEGSGYTQYAGYWTTVLSEYHISKPLYDFFEREPLPPVDDRTVEVAGDRPYEEPQRFREGPIPRPGDVPPDFDADLERRLNAAGSTGGTGNSPSPPGGP